MQVGPYKVPGGVIVWPMVYALHNRWAGGLGSAAFSLLQHLHLGNSQCRPIS